MIPGNTLSLVTFTLLSCIFVILASWQISQAIHIPALIKIHTQHDVLVQCRTPGHHIAASNTGDSSQPRRIHPEVSHPHQISAICPERTPRPIRSPSPITEYSDHITLHTTPDFAGTLADFSAANTEKALGSHISARDRASPTRLGTFTSPIRPTILATYIVNSVSPIGIHTTRVPNRAHSKASNIRPVLKVVMVFATLCAGPLLLRVLGFY